MPKLLDRDEHAGLVSVSATVMAVTTLSLVVAFSPNVVTPAQRTDATSLDQEAM